MKILILSDGSGSELKVDSNGKDSATLKIYTDIHGGVEKCQEIELDVRDIKSLIKELKRIKYDLS